MPSNRQNPSVIVIGAGMTGILVAIKLKEAGISNITVIEKKDSIGGTWRENTYPGIACDVPSHAYTYSFAPNPNWSSHFPHGGEIHQYFSNVFTRYGIDKLTRFNETVTSCIYGDDSQQWTVQTSKGDTLTADLVFSACGLLHHPKFPEVPGYDDFTGPKFHSAQWDHDVELKGKRIGIIGTGSTACQIIPELVKLEGSDVTVFQRTPQWTVSMGDRDFSEDEKRRFAKQPWRMKLIRWLSKTIYSLGTAALTGDGWFDRQCHKLMAKNGRDTLNKAVSDPELRAKLTPDYKFGCKRVVISSKFYGAIQQANAHLITDNIDRFEAGGIRTKDGTLHELDIIVMATGFDAAAFMRPMEFTGKGGLSIDLAWQKKMRAYRSLFLPQFPNFILMLGPNSPIGNQSVIEISERQMAYVMQLIEQWRKGKLDTIEVKEEATAAWAAMIKERMGHTVWTSGCNSWYLDADGDALSWPDTWNRWIATMKTPDLKDFITSKASPARSGHSQ